MGFAIGITIVFIGCIVLVWVGVLSCRRNRPTSGQVGSEIERARESNTDVECGLIDADRTCEELAGTVGHLQDTVGKLADVVDESGNLIEEIRKHKKTM